MDGPRPRPSGLQQFSKVSKLTAKMNSRNLLLKPRVFRFGLLQDGNIGVGVFPESQEIQVGAASFCGIFLQCVGTRKLESGNGAQRKICHQPAMIDELLEFRCRRSAISFCHEGLAAHVRGAKRDGQLGWRCAISCWPMAASHRATSVFMPLAAPLLQSCSASSMAFAFKSRAILARPDHASVSDRASNKTPSAPGLPCARATFLAISAGDDRCVNRIMHSLTLSRTLGRKLWGFTLFLLDKMANKW